MARELHMMEARDICVKKAQQSTTKTAEIGSLEDFWPYGTTAKKLYRVYANRTRDPITARKFNFRNFLYFIRTEATVYNYFL